MLSDVELRDAHATLFGELDAARASAPGGAKSFCWAQKWEHAWREPQARGGGAGGGGGGDATCRGETLCLPHAYLLGVPKAGTSELWEKVLRHATRTRRAQGSALVHPGCARDRRGRARALSLSAPDVARGSDALARSLLTPPRLSQASSTRRRRSGYPTARRRSSRSPSSSARSRSRSTRPTTTRSASSRAPRSRTTRRSAAAAPQRARAPRARARGRALGGGPHTLWWSSQDQGDGRATADRRRSRSCCTVRAGRAARRDARRARAARAIPTTTSSRAPASRARATSRRTPPDEFDALARAQARARARSLSLSRARAALSHALGSPLAPPPRADERALRAPPRAAARVSSSPCRRARTTAALGLPGTGGSRSGCTPRTRALPALVPARAAARAALRGRGQGRRRAPRARRPRLRAPRSRAAERAGWAAILGRRRRRRRRRRPARARRRPGNTFKFERPAVRVRRRGRTAGAPARARAPILRFCRSRARSRARRSRSPPKVRRDTDDALREFTGRTTRGSRRCSATPRSRGATCRPRPAATARGDRDKGAAARRAAAPPPRKAWPRSSTARALAAPPRARAPPPRDTASYRERAPPIWRARRVTRALLRVSRDARGSVEHPSWYTGG